MRKGFVLSIDLMAAMSLFTLLLLLIQSNSQAAMAQERELLLKESAYISASDCLLLAENALLSGDLTLINTTLGECTGRRTNIFIQYHQSGEVLEVRNFRGTKSVSARRLLTIMDGSNATEFIIAALEVET